LIGGSLLPRGIPESSEAKASNLTTEDFAMVMVMVSAEGIEPTYRRLGGDLIGPNGMKPYKSNSRILKLPALGSSLNNHQMLTLLTVNGFCISKRMQPVKSRSIRQG
jgi:hypothetical protein